MKILCIGDVHEPVSHPGYLSFCQDLYYQWDCDTVIFMGDIADFQAISFHANNPMCPSPIDEYVLTKQKIQKWCKAFPKAKLCIGNHDERVIRLAESVNIPPKFLRNFSEIWKTPDWEWKYEHIIDDIYFFHGIGFGGIHPAYNAAGKLLMSTVMGHLHARSGIKWRANPLRRIFAIDTGCGIDVDAYQFAYGKHIKERPILSAAVILDGVPYHEIMPCGRGEIYHKSNFKGGVGKS